MGKRKLTSEDFETMAMPTMFVAANYAMVSDIIDRDKFLYEYMCRIKNGGQVKDGNGVLIYGEPLTRKSTLSAYIAKTFREYNHSVQWVDALELQDMISEKRTYLDQNDFSEILMAERLKTVDILVIDDLGAEVSAVYKRNYPTEIIQHRWKWAKLTIVNTSFSIDETETVYGYRFTQRLYQNMVNFHLAEKRI